MNPATVVTTYLFCLCFIFCHLGFRLWGFLADRTGAEVAST